MDTNPVNPPAPVLPPPPSFPGASVQPVAPPPMPAPVLPRPAAPPQPVQPVASPVNPVPSPNFAPPLSNMPPPTSATGPMPENPTLNTPPLPPKRNPLIKIVGVVVGLLVLISGGFFGYQMLIEKNNPSSDTASKNTPSNANLKGKTLVYWGLWEPNSLLETVFSEFEQKTGVKVNYQQQSHKDYRERLQSELAKGTGPDIYRFHNTWVPMFSNELDVLPESVMSAREFSETFYPVASKDLTTSQGVVGIPLMIDGLGLYYNRDMLETAGKTPPTTWDELRSLASDLTIKSGAKIERAGIALGLAGNVDNFSDILGLMLLQNGANPANPTNTKAKDAITFYRIFTATDKDWDSTLAPSTYSFATEKVAMIIAPSWRAHEIIQINPDLDFAIASLPQLPSSNVTWASYWVEGVSRKSANKDAAWALLNYLSTKEVMRQMYTAASQERLFGEPFSRVDMQDQLIGDQYVGAYISQAPNAVSWPMSSRTFDNGLNDGVIKAYEDLINGGATDAALQQAANEITRILQLYAVNPSQ